MGRLNVHFVGRRATGPQWLNYEASTTSSAAAAGGRQNGTRGGVRRNRAAPSPRNVWLLV